MKFIGKTVERNLWITGKSKIDWNDGTVSVGEAGEMERVHPESVGVHFGDKDAYGKEVFTGHILRHIVTLETACYLYEPTKHAIVVITADDTYMLSELPDGFLDDYEIFTYSFDCPKTEELKTDNTEVVTTDKFWDCNCDTNYVHPKSTDKCQFCGVHRDNQPDSREDEVTRNMANIEPIDYDAKEHQGNYADDPIEDE